ncbi:MAG TPA: hypothetical protein VM925_07580, partial [Labilithrix sp.]|nr:hypothetical protein [Labilithrix sp.]
MMRTLRSSKRPRLAVFASVIVFAGCGLFVGDRKQAVCDFAGRAGACGECLSSACVDATFACCGGSDCRSALET